jgi:hypothetical protein
VKLPPARLPAFLASPTLGSVDIQARKFADELDGGRFAVGHRHQRRQNATLRRQTPPNATHGDVVSRL